MSADELNVEVTTDHPCQRRILLRITVDVQALVGQVADTRSEAKAKQMHQRKQVVS